jgi:hypothetical protein
MNLGSNLSPGATMNRGDWLTSPLAECTLEFTGSGQLILTYKDTTKNLTPTIGHNGQTCSLTSTELEIMANSTSPPLWSSPSIGFLLGLDVQDNGEAVLYAVDGTSWVVGSPSVSAEAIVTGAAQVQMAIDQVQTRFAKLSADIAGFIAAHQQKPAEIALDGAATDYNKPVTALRPRALDDEEEAEDTGT